MAALSGTGATIGTIDTANIADDAITQAKIADNAVGADQISGNSVSASEINVSGNGTSGQYLSADGDGSFTFATLPTAFVSGMLMPYAGASAPSGWLLCYGQAISRSTYADLFTALGTTYGVGNGSSTFNLPDLRGRTIAGQDDMGGASANNLTDQTAGIDGDTLGAVGGTETQGLSVAQLPSHSHGTVVTGVTPSFKTNTGDGGASVVQSIRVSSGATSTGSGAEHNNVQPTIILNYIIKE